MTMITAEKNCSIMIVGFKNSHSVTTKGRNRFTMPSMGSRTTDYAEDRAGGPLMPLRGERSERTLTPLTSEQGELRELTSEQGEQYYYIGRMNPLKGSIVFNF